MAEYIEREAFLTAFEIAPDEWCKGQTVRRILAELPAADVVPVVHGRWVDKPTGKYGNWQSWCSACGKHSGIGGIRSNQHKPYCPNCGARMDGDS